MTGYVSPLEGENEGEHVAVDPYPEMISPLLVENEGGIEAPIDIASSNTSSAPVPQWNKCIQKPTQQLIKFSLFGFAAVQNSRFQRFNLCMKALWTLSFTSLQHKFSFFAQQLELRTYSGI